MLLSNQSQLQEGVPDKSHTTNIQTVLNQSQCYCNLNLCYHRLYCTSLQSPIAKSKL